MHQSKVVSLINAKLPLKYVIIIQTNSGTWLIKDPNSYILHKVKMDLPEILRKSEVVEKEGAGPQFESKN